MVHSPEMSLPYVVSSPSEQDDTHLVQASQQGDQDAFASLVQRHQRRVFTLVLRMLQDSEEANEITQEAFLAAWLGLSSFRGESRFANWLYRIAYNCALKQLERHSTCKAQSGSVGSSPPDGARDPGPWLSSWHPPSDAGNACARVQPDRWRCAWEHAG